ncbi:MAG: glycosyltransferase N-terminal domain-containing protein [Planctomycetota bacterium]
MNPLDAGYALAATAAAPLLLRKQRGGWNERLGGVRRLPASAGRPRVMLHAVSVGEANALRTLVPLLTPRAEVIVTATTDTGIARARSLFGGSAHVLRFPLDASWSVERFLSRVRPDVVGMVELEIWPNFLAACRRRGVPTAVINGRLSERSFRGYRRARPIVGGMFASLACAAVQDESYAARFAAMGVAKVKVTGSMKWDAANLESVGAEADALAAALGIDRGKPLIVAGSTGPGEEKLLREACPAGVQLLCAPRKPERFEGAALDLGPCVRRSEPETRPAGATRFLLDSIGELRAAYELADVVVMGRSFGDLFGSDPIEPIALGRATVIGLRVDDFRAVVSAFDAAGGIVRSDRDRLADDLVKLVRDPAARAAVAARGRACIDGHRGASVRHASMLMDLVPLRRRTRRG